MILDELYESPQTCPECGGPAFSDLLLAEKKDACYHKVRSRYKVWPSAYASGALVQCRKKGAANWGNKSKNEGVEEGPEREMDLDWHYKNIMQTKGLSDKAKKQTTDIYNKLKKKKQQGVAEGPGFDKWADERAASQLHKLKKPHPETWHDVDKKLGKAVDKMSQAEKVKKGLAHPDTLKKKGVAEGNFAGDSRVELGGTTAKKLQSGDTVSYFGEPARVVELNPAKNYARISANGKTLNVRLSDLKRTGQGVEETQYDRGDYYNAHKAGEYGRDLPFDDDRRGHGASRSKERDGRDDHLAGQSANLPADPFGRITGAVPKAGTGRIHNIALPGEIDEADKIGNMDADQFDAAMARLKKLAGQGPLKTVWDPQKRVYRNVPVAQQPKQQPGK